MESTKVPEVGSYARKQLFGASRILSWSHQSRFRFAVQLVKKMRAKSVLDYGCGDGTFLYLLGDHGTRRIGVDYDENQIRDCIGRFQKEIEFYHTQSFSPDEKVEVVTCMEVIEHCTAEQRKKVLEDIQKVLSPHGSFLLSAPIEVGLPLLVKHIVRWFLAMTRFPGYQYREKYSFRELCSMIFASSKTKVQRPIYSTVDSKGSKREWHGHKGFNWKAFEKELENDFFVESIHFTPCDFGNGWFSSQVWFLCRKK